MKNERGLVHAKQLEQHGETTECDLPKADLAVLFWRRRYRHAD